MKVWVVEPNEYDAYGIEGVYADFESVRASHPGKWTERNGEWLHKADSRFHRIDHDLTAREWTVAKVREVIRELLGL